MRRTLPILLSLSFVIPILFVSDAFAANDYMAKPLIVEPSAQTKPKDDPNTLPKDFTDERQKIRDELSSALRESAQIQAECDVPQTAAAHAQCEKKERDEKTKLDGIYARMHEFHHKLDTWRRKQAGLPPAPWPPINQSTGQAKPDGTTGSTTSKHENSVLLPDAQAPLPAHTF